MAFEALDFDLNLLREMLEFPEHGGRAYYGSLLYHYFPFVASCIIFRRVLLK